MDLPCHGYRTAMPAACGFRVYVIVRSVVLSGETEGAERMLLWTWNVRWHHTLRGRIILIALKLVRRPNG